MIVLDASVLIAYLDRDDAHHAAAESLLTGAVDDDLAVNSLSLAEVLVVPIRDGRLDRVLAALHDLEIHEIVFPSNTAVRLAQLRASVGLKMPDCCVLLAAEEEGATVASFDERLLAAAERRGLSILGG
ncbi:PIN domain-containing protein [Lapillicoccus sp.]|uniref:type II toxin-antitoxin system VapC family toxin n=1 Tax=Lapillicoccus sp. TaxID=1909287 RepID=UPI0025FDD022|nr:PIN domain-containing protein [Lapillicoccus sp.]